MTLVPLGQQERQDQQAQLVLPAIPVLPVRQVLLVSPVTLVQQDPLAQLVPKEMSVLRVPQDQPE